MLGSAFLLVSSLLDFAVDYARLDSAWLAEVMRWMSLALTFAAAGALLGVQPDLDRPVVAPAKERSSSFSEASRLALMRLDAVMGKGEAWRRAGLTMEALAAETGVSERQLRRLINERLGHTNFSGFLNSYRIEAAKSRLANPKAANATLAEIASELGYASLATFHRLSRKRLDSLQAPGARPFALSPSMHLRMTPVLNEQTGPHKTGQTSDPGRF